MPHLTLLSTVRPIKVARRCRRSRGLLAMKAVVQRVKSASVHVDGQQISAIKEGLLCLIGVTAKDNANDCDYILRKILNTRIFQNPANDRPWDMNPLVCAQDGLSLPAFQALSEVMQKEFGVLLVSQFTLCGVMKGNKPDYHLAMPPTDARTFYADFVEMVKQKYAADRVHNGEFGAMMDVSLVNDGPVTLIFDSQSH
ncbi:hypothetical protein WJX84_009873 [Apatococcus fuscideae]|uniref:D-aminoacyl-tRNA deacylase n=1 Tax=Apatococcus fuscideae TaxID=2026836 RepID=A0AAW1TEL3_9CHLO